MMSENLLSVFKKELGYVNDTNQYVELSIRITEKEHSLDLRNNLQGLAQSVSVWFKNVFSYESSDKKRAGECRKLFDHKNLISYELEEIEERALALTKIVVLVKWKSNDIVHTEHFEFGCSYQQEDGNVGYPWKNNGAWILIPWKIQGLYK